VNRTPACLAVLAAVAALSTAPLAAGEPRIKVQKSLQAEAYDLSALDYYGRLGAFLSALVPKDTFLVVARDRDGTGRTVFELPAGQDQADTAQAIVAKGFRDRDVEVFQRVVGDDETPAGQVVLYNQSAALYASGSGKFVKRVRDAVLKTPELSLKDAYGQARYDEGPLAPPRPPVDEGAARVFYDLADRRDLAGLIKAFRVAEQDAAAHPGRQTHGKPWLGQPDYYDPSPAELLLAEAGKALAVCLQFSSQPPQALALARSLQDLDEVPGTLTFKTWTYTRVDAIGSGRFTFPNPPSTETCNPLAVMLNNMSGNEAYDKEIAAVERLKTMPLDTAEQRATMLEQMVRMLKRWDRAY